MNKKSITEQVDICEIVFTAVENQLPDAAEEWNELMKKLFDILDRDTFNQLDQATNYRVYKAQQESFKVGWAMRAQV